TRFSANEPRTDRVRRTTKLPICFWLERRSRIHELAGPRRFPENSLRPDRQFRARLTKRVAIGLLSIGVTLLPIYPRPYHRPPFDGLAGGRVRHPSDLCSYCQRDLSLLTGVSGSDPPRGHPRVPVPPRLRPRRCGCHRLAVGGAPIPDELYGVSGKFS